MRRGWGNLGLFSRVPGVPGAAIWAPARAQGLSRSLQVRPKYIPKFQNMFLLFVSVFV